MTFVGISALLISIVAVMFAFPDRRSDRYSLAFLLLIFHVGASIVYYLYVQRHDADTKLYYFDPLGFAHGQNAFGTIFLVKLVQGMRGWFGGSYFEYFLAFQCVGLIGIVILSRIIAEIQQGSQLPPTKWATWALFVPSLHFWTSAIGKDAPLLFASSLAAWSLIKLSSRWLWFAAAMVVMVLFRPHIALIATISLTIALLIDSRYNPLPRIMFGAIALVSLGYLAQATSDTLNFNPADPNSVADFITSRQDTFGMIGGTTAFHGAFPLRLISLLFRPFFFDAHGVFGIISSVENLLLLLGFLSLLRNWREVWRRLQAGIYSRYCYAFTIILTVSLAILYYNVGLGLRQRVMVYPTLLPLLVAARAIAAARKRGDDLPSLRVRNPASPYPLPDAGQAVLRGSLPPSDGGLRRGKAGE